MEGYIALHNLCLSVCLVHNYVGIPQTCATYNWITLTPIDFKLRTPNNINIMMIPIALQVKVIFDFVTKVGISVLQAFYKHLLFTLICKFYTECPQFAISILFDKNSLGISRHSKIMLHVAMALQREP